MTEQRLTPEREEEFVAFVDGGGRLYPHEAKELLAELDALRAERDWLAENAMNRECPIGWIDGLTEDDCPRPPGRTAEGRPCRCHSDAACWLVATRRVKEIADTSGIVPPAA